MDRLRIDVGERFRSQDYPTIPAVQPADYTAYPTGEKKIGVICQDGLMKRQADADVFKTSVAIPSPIEREKLAVVAVNKSISVADQFRSQDYPYSKAFQPADYTAYPLGVRKIGLISQDGLMKRRADAVAYKTSIAVSSLKKAGSSPNKGFLFAVDKFFNWVNKVIGG